MGGRGESPVMCILFLLFFSFSFFFSVVLSMFVFLFFFLPLAFKVGSVHGWGKKEKKGRKKTRNEQTQISWRGSNGMSEEEGGLMEDPFYMHFFLQKGGVVMI